MLLFHNRFHCSFWVVVSVVFYNDIYRPVCRNLGVYSFLRYIWHEIPCNIHDIVSGKIGGDYSYDWSKCASYFPFVTLVNLNNLYYKLQYIRGSKLMKYEKIIIRNLDWYYLFWNSSLHVADSNECNSTDQIYTSFCIGGHFNTVCIVCNSKFFEI